MRWLLGSFMHRTLRCTHPFWIVFGSGTTFTRKSKSVLDFSKSDSFIWGKRPKTHGGRKLSSQGNPSSSMALAWHWLSSVCKWLNNIMPRYLHWWWDIMRCASFCRRLSIARISARLALAFLSSAWSSFLRVHNLRACIRISQESLAQLRPLGRGACCLIHSLQTSFQIRNSPSPPTTQCSSALCLALPLLSQDPCSKKDRRRRKGFPVQVNLVKAWYCL